MYHAIVTYQDPGPVPTLKNAKYIAIPIMIKDVEALNSIQNDMLTKSKAPAIPIREMNISFLLPERSKSFPPITTKSNFKRPNRTKTTLCFSRESIPEFEMISG